VILTTGKVEMKKVLISFIGTGRKAQGEGKEEYIKTLYQLPNGKLIETSLLVSALFNYIKPDKLVVIGTPESIWSELANINPKLLETNPFYEKIFNATWDDKTKITSELLKEWEQLLTKELSTEIKLNLLDSNDLEAEVIFDILYREIPENVEEVYLDVTHALRHFPIVASFSLPILKYLKSFKKLQLIYGKLVKSPKPSPVIFMQTPNRLIELLEAISLTENAGNFEKFAGIFGNKHIRELYLKIETNRRISNKQFKNLTNNLTNNLTKNSVIKSFAAKYLTEKVFEEIIGENLSERMAKRAIFFAERNQFLKAYTLIFEALINTQPEPQMKGREIDIYNEKKNRLERNLDSSQWEIYHTIRYIRNTIVHGSEPPNNEIRNIIHDEEQLRKWVYRGYNLVMKLTKG